jgi:hypothetical protein
MKLNIIHEPELEFGRGFSPCPRTGIAEHDVYDARFNARRERILIGAVGTSDNLEELGKWLDRCSRLIPSPADCKQPNLHIPFCGFNRAQAFKANFVYGDEITRSLHQSDIRNVLKIANWNKRIEEAVELYYRHIKFLTQNRTVDVIVCVVPSDLYDKISKQTRKPLEEHIDDEGVDDAVESNFRRALKARAMHLGKPLQIIRDQSFETSEAQQDDATKAWNFCTALYYKANQTVPWRLPTNKNRPSVCYVGIGFYRSRDRQVLNTSLAQIFDELGNGVILRGTPVDISKDDRQAHLKHAQAYELLKRAVTEYEIAMESSPGRLVLHKTSNFTDEEKDGFRQAATELRIKTVDFITILDSNLRLFRDGEYPPYRGTQIELSKDIHLLYTRGAVGHYKTYPGLYVPQPLEIRIVEADESPGVICQEILCLTKMNWNNTQFDGKYPITIQCARKVGEIMKYLGPTDIPQISYSYYM